MPARTEPTREKAPAEPCPFYQKALVQCEGFRGLPYRNLAGQWKTVTGNKTLTKVIEIVLLK